MTTLLQNNPLIRNLSAVYEMKDREIFINKEYYNKVQKDLNSIQDFFEVEEKVAALIAIIFCEQVSGHKFNIFKISHNLGFEPIDYLITNTIFTEFKKKGWMISESQNYSGKEKNKVVFSKDVVCAILNNDKSELEIKVPENLIEAMLKIGKFVKSVMRDSDSEYMIEVILSYVSKFDSFPLIESILNNPKISNNEKALLFYIMASTVAGAESFDLDYDLDKFSYADPSFQYVFKNDVKSGKSILFTDGYLAFSDGYMADFSEITIGGFLKEHLQKELPDKNYKKPFFPKFTNVIKPEEIIEKKLFFNLDNQSQIDEVIQITSDSYDSVVSRFKENGLQPGLTMLFHGAAGTGKTEFVKQIAKQNNRVVIMVDLSLLHNMFVGESEKNIRRVFSEYREAMVHFERTPILLFNEADSIFSKRNVVEKAVDQMLNSVQNMLLQELEDFEGIFIATTNLLINLDKAFDRRILYKMNFNSPDKDTRKAILKENFNELTDELLDKISNEYLLSGGQIANIKKRCLTEQLLFGNQASKSEKLISYVEQELNFRKSGKPIIGFA